jgi:hypothetical protein
MDYGQPVLSLCNACCSVTFNMDYAVNTNPFFGSSTTFRLYDPIADEFKSRCLVVRPHPLSADQVLAPPMHLSMRAMEPMRTTLKLSACARQNCRLHIMLLALSGTGLSSRPCVNARAKDVAHLAEWKPPVLSDMHEESLWDFSEPLKLDTAALLLLIIVSPSCTHQRCGLFLLHQPPCVHSDDHSA